MDLEYPLSSSIVTHMFYIDRSLRAVMRQCSLNLAQYRMLGLLARSRNGLSPKQLAEGLSLTQGSIASALGELQRWGFVALDSIEGDRRRKLVTLTTAAEAVISDVDVRASLFVRDLWRPLTAEQQEAILAGCEAADLAVGPTAWWRASHCGDRGAPSNFRAEKSAGRQGSRRGMLSKTALQPGGGNERRRFPWFLAWALI